MVFPFPRGAVCAIVASLAALSASADEVHFGGTLTMKSVDEFIRLNDDKPVTLLSIASPGGIAGAGIRLGRWVRQKNADVRDSVVMWHGGMQEWTLGEVLDEYRKQAAQAMRPAPDPYAKIAVAALRRYSTLAEQRDMEASYLKEIGVDGALFVLGGQPVKYDTEWRTATVGVMERYGIKDVEAPAGYGTADYMNKTIFRKLYFKDARVTFELGPDGAVVAAPVGQ